MFERIEPIILVDDVEDERVSVTSEGAKARRHARRLDNVDLSLDEREDRDEELDGITERGVQETAKRVSDTKGKLLGGETPATR